MRPCVDRAFGGGGSFLGAIVSSSYKERTTELKDHACIDDVMRASNVDPNFVGAQRNVILMCVLLLNIKLFFVNMISKENFHG